MMVSKGNHPQMALFQVGEILKFTQMDYMDYIFSKMGLNPHNLVGGDWNMTGLFFFGNVIIPIFTRVYGC